MQNERWLLPEGIEEVLPREAQMLENARRQLLDLYNSWGYELVMPPLIEFLDSLLTGTGADLDLQTFKLTDQVSGRLMGVRADITPQVARMDAHRLRRDEPTRLCYLGTVLHTLANGFSASRSPLQIGAEVYGHAGVESDIEIVRLLMQTLAVTGVQDVYLDLGHVGIFRGLARQAGLQPQQEQELFDALQRKAAPEIDQLVRKLSLSPDLSDMLHSLAELNGDDALERAEKLLFKASGEVQEALQYLSKVAAQLKQWLPDVPVHFDLAELRGYHYKTGVVFAAFVPKLGEEIARGGRYDDIGRVFGRARPAVGFSADLKTLLACGRLEQGAAQDNKVRVCAPWSADPKLQENIAALRAEGIQVVCELPGQNGDARAMACSQVLLKRGDDWVLETLED